MNEQELQQKAQMFLGLLIECVSAFFNGKAAIMIGEMPIRFKKDE